MLGKPLIQQFKVYLFTVKYLKASTAKNYCYEAQQFLNWFTKNNQIDFEKIDLTKYIEHKINLKSLTNASINNVVKQITLFYEFLKEEKYIKQNTLLNYDKTGAEQRVYFTLSIDEINMLCKTFDNSELGLRNNALLEILFSSGLRINEALSITTHNYLNNYNVVLNKMNTERFFIINNEAREKINKYLSTKKISTTYLFSSVTGKQIGRSDVNDVIKKSCELAGISKKVTSHTFRRSFATILQEGGANIIEIKDLLGHQNIFSTEIYIGKDYNYLREQIKLLPRYTNNEKNYNKISLENVLEFLVGRKSCCVSVLQKRMKITYALAKKLYSIFIEDNIITNFNVRHQQILVQNKLALQQLLTNNLQFKQLGIK